MFFLWGKYIAQNERGIYIPTLSFIPALILRYKIGECSQLNYSYNNKYTLLELKTKHYIYNNTKRENMPSLTDKYIDPLTDFGFKRLFGTEAHKDLLIDFLNHILPDFHQIEDITYLKNEQVGENVTDRTAIFDIHCKCKSGEHVIVELQKLKQTFFIDRSIFYSTRPISSQAPKGEWDFELKGVYTIAILDFALEEFKESDKVIHHVQLKDEDGKVFYKKLSYIYIELPKFKKKLEELETSSDKWLFVFRWLSQLQKRPKALQERVFQKLFKIAEISKFNEMERLQYEESLKQLRDNKNVMDYAAQEGEKKGINKEKLASIKAGLEEGFTLFQISKFTRLTIQELKAIIKEQDW